jgi:hypothetical protein
MGEPFLFKVSVLGERRKDNGRKLTLWTISSDKLFIRKSSPICMEWKPLTLFYKSRILLRINPVIPEIHTEI